MIRRPPRSTQGVSSAASDVYKRQVHTCGARGAIDRRARRHGFRCGRPVEEVERASGGVAIIRRGGPHAAATANLQQTVLIDRCRGRWPQCRVERGGASQRTAARKRASPYAGCRGRRRRFLRGGKEKIGGAHRARRSLARGFDAESRGGLVSETSIILIRYDYYDCLLYTSPSPRDATLSRMPSSA